MNKDFRMSTCFWDHPKTVKLKRSLGYEGIESLQRLWSFAAKNKPTGIFTNMDAEDIEIACKWDGEIGKLIEELVRLKWLICKDGVYALHDWEDWNGYASKAEERSKIARQNAEKRWNNANGNATGMQTALQDDTECNAPSPNPVPKPKPDENSLYVRAIVEYLNEKASKNYKPSTAATKRHINARLAEGFTTQDFKIVIDNKCHDWLGSDMSQYLRPETLFGSKFESYLNQGDSQVETHRVIK